MLTIDAPTMNHVLNRRIRQRELQIPVACVTRRAPDGTSWTARQKPPGKPGSVVRLAERIDYQAHQQTAAHEPSRARAVLRLIDLCSRQRQVTVTIRTVDLVYKNGHPDHYKIIFELGDHAGLLDQPVFLGRGTDYTMIPSRAIDKAEVLMPLAADLARAREKATERRLTPGLEHTRRAITQTGELQRAMVSMKARNLARRAERTLKALETVLLAEACVSLGLSTPADGSQAEDDRPPVGAAVASLNDAA